MRPHRFPPSAGPAARSTGVPPVSTASRFPRRTLPAPARGIVFQPVLLGLAVILVTIAGCAPKQPAPSDPSPSRVSPATQPSFSVRSPIDPELSLDPCADRLHELAGLLLRYLLTHDQLPPSLRELSPTPLTCPASGQSYVYARDGIPYSANDFAGRIVILDPAPSHDGIRWGIALAHPAPGQPLATRIVPVPTATTPTPNSPVPWR